MSSDSKRPVLVLLTSHWVSRLGVALVTTAGSSWLFVLPIQLRGHANNPYIGIVVFIFIPVIFVFGLVLIAFGIFLARRRIALVEQGLLEGTDRNPILGESRSSSPAPALPTLSSEHKALTARFSIWKPFSSADRAAT